MRRPWLCGVVLIGLRNQPALAAWTAHNGGLWFGPQHRQQLVRRPELASPNIRRNQRCRFQLFCRIRAHVDFRALKAGMPQPQSYLSNITRCVKVCIAQECLKVCGETRFLVSEGCFWRAVLTCFSRMYLKPDLVMRSP